MLNNSVVLVFELPIQLKTVALCQLSFGIAQLLSKEKLCMADDLLQCIHLGIKRNFHTPVRNITFFSKQCTPKQFVSALRVHVFTPSCQGRKTGNFLIDIVFSICFRSFYFPKHQCYIMFGTASR